MDLFVVQKDHMRGQIKKERSPGSCRYLVKKMVSWIEEGTTNMQKQTCTYLTYIYANMCIQPKQQQKVGEEENYTEVGQFKSCGQLQVPSQAINICAPE